MMFPILPLKFANGSILGALNWSRELNRTTKRECRALNQRQRVVQERAHLAQGGFDVVGGRLFGGLGLGCHLYALSVTGRRRRASCVAATTPPGRNRQSIADIYAGCVSAD